MKTIIFVFLATLLAGCANPGQFAQNFGQGLQYTAQARQQQPPPQYVPVKSTDFQCLNNCTAQGYSYGLCTSKCTY